MASTMEPKIVSEPKMVRLGHSPMKSRKKGDLGGTIVWRAILDSFVKLDPRHMMGNPVMFVVEIGSVITTVLLVRGGSGISVQSADHVVAVVHGAVCQLCRGHGRRPRQGAGRHAAESALGDDCQSGTGGTARSSRSPARSCAPATW